MEAILLLLLVYLLYKLGERMGEDHRYDMDGE